MIKQDGGPAFPAQPHKPAGVTDWIAPKHHGMTLRDYFAARALQGLLDNVGLHALGIAADRAGKSVSSNTAQAAYELADAMLKAREP
jgi:hypothetical protein